MFMQKVMNLKIKFREGFRPFAPIVLREKASEYFVRGTVPSWGSPNVSGLPRICRSFPHTEPPSRAGSRPNGPMIGGNPSP